jgi:hypothetical protein
MEELSLIIGNKARQCRRGATLGGWDDTNGVWQKTYLANRPRAERWGIVGNAPNVHVSNLYPHPALVRKLKYA